MKRRVVLAITSLILCANSKIVEVRETLSEGVISKRTDGAGITFLGDWAQNTLQKVDGKSVSEMVTLRMKMGVGGVTWEDGTFVQMFASFENSAIPGTFSSFTCNAEYNTFQEYSTTVVT